MSAATTVAAMAFKARREIIDHFMAADAVSADKAVGIDPGRRLRRRQFARLVDAGVVREAGSDRWYLDVPTYAAQTNKRRRFRLAGIVMAVAGAAAAGLFAH
ncbi:MAG TPA: hypothetical protein VF695_05255 [Sphingomonas sp.]|jgi:hypothetical protein